LSAPSTSKQRRTKARATRRKASAEKRRLAARAKSEQDEIKAEDIAPAVQRHAVLGRNGEVLRGPRLEVDGPTVQRSNPVRRMRLMNRHKDMPLVTKAHEDAADQLLKSWALAQTISVGVGAYDERMAGMASAWGISEAVLKMTNEQIRARREIETVHTYLGPLWNVLHAVVILGLDVSAWGEANGMAPSVSSGYLAAALDRLLSVYAPKRDRPQKIRAAEIKGIVVEEIQS
jgi:hypothetical protein